jgi:hypothetical protein
MNRISGRIGDHIYDADQLDELPVGSNICVEGSNNHRFEKQRNGAWRDVNYGANNYEASAFVGGRYVILSLPDGWEDAGPAGKQTVQKFMWEFREGALHAATANGVSLGAVQSALEEMGVGDSVFPLGPEVRVKNTVDQGRLPRGSVVFSGSPERIGGFGVWVKNRSGRWTHLLGERQGVPTTIMVDRVEGVDSPPEWWTRSGDDSDDAAIREFKARAWRVGYKLKRSQSWCGTYEQIVNGLGIHASDQNYARVGGVSVGDRVNPELARTLPRGTVLRWTSHDHPEWFAVLGRMRGTGNRAGTRRLYGQHQRPDNLRNYWSTMEVVYLPSDTTPELEFPMVDFAREVPLLPPGSVFHTDGSADYNVCEDHTITDAAMPNGRPNAHGRWTVANFGTGPRGVVTRIPGFEVER